MESPNDIEIRVIRYLEDEMSVEEKITFEESLMHDDKLKNCLNEYMQLLDGVEKWGDQLLKENIRHIETKLQGSGFFEQDQIFKTDSKKILFGIYKYAAAAAVLLVLLTYAFLLPMNFKVTHHNIFASYYKHDTTFAKQQLQIFEQSGFIPSNARNDTFRIAVQKYIQADFANSLDLLLNLTDSIQTKDICQYFIGLNYIGLEKYHEAELVFNALCEHREFTDRQNGCWMLALCLIKEDTDPRRINALLDELIQNNAKQKIQAQEISKMLQ